MPGIILVARGLGDASPLCTISGKEAGPWFFPGAIYLSGRILDFHTGGELSIPTGHTSLPLFFCLFQKEKHTILSNCHVRQLRSAQAGV